MSDEIVQEFLVESAENLDLLDRELVTLEKEPGNKATLSSIFRTIHTIKGTCSFLGFPKLESVAHTGENLLSLLRDGVLELNPERTTALLALVDAIRQMLESIGSTGNEGARDDHALIEKLKDLQKVDTPRKTADVAPAPKPQINTIPPADPTTPSMGEIKPLGRILVESGKATAEEVAAAIKKQLEGDKRNLGEILIEAGVLKTQEVLAAVQVQQAAKSNIADASIRVDVALLDKLMNLVGELVLSRNQILQFTNGTVESGLAASSQRLNLITSELQEGVMKTRMQPIGNIWSKFPRTVRDVAVSCGKQVRIEMEGKETELDRSIIESIKDPLTHLVRNSVDHGIETPEVREKAGKPAEGLLLLRAYHEGGQVNIEITDDGAGLNAERIRKKALERGLITAEQAARLSEREAANLIFLPGFSTAEAVTNVSGRGVGMDVVKTNIEKIGGTVEVQTKSGAGTTVKMKIPLTLAIIPALMITSGEERFAIPQVNLLELLRIEARQVEKTIEKVQGSPVYRLRGQLLPLIYLRKELKLDGCEAGPQTENQAVNIIVLHAEGRKFGLVVDQVNDTEEIVVKPLSKQLKNLRAFAGAMIQGDGKVALILDVRGLAQAAGLIGESSDTTKQRKVEEAALDTGKDRQTLLLFQSGNIGRMAIDLSLVARLEEFQSHQVEKASGWDVIQYRGQIMPLVRVAEVLGKSGHRRKREELQPGGMQVVVVKENGKSVGLIVERILDIVEEVIDVQQPTKRPGLRGTAVIQNQVTDLLDAGELVRMAREGMQDAKAEQAVPSEALIHG